MPSPHQPRVPPWLRMPRTCGTNPQDLVRFPPSPSLCFKLLSPSPLSVLLHQFFFTFDFHVRIQLQPVTFFPLICSVAPSRFYQFPPSAYNTNSLIASPILSSFCLSLTASYFFPCLLTHYLHPLSFFPCGNFRISPRCTSPFLFSFSPSSSSSLYGTTHTGRALKFICTSAAHSTEAFQGSWLWPWKNSATMATRYEACWVTTSTLAN